jgi:branched-chain amino acid transport system ATP-binding protein
MLRLNNIEVMYSDVILVLKGVSLQVPPGQIIALLGANGAGKTTVLKAISGLLNTELGKVTDGTIEFEGGRIDRLDPEKIVKRGIVQIMEGQRVFEHLTVEENLLVGAYPRSDKAVIREDLDRIYTYFPKLKELRVRTSGYLSGGERQMLAIGRALMGKPKIMLLDEPSMGLSPLFVKEIFRLLKEINIREGVSILLVEQNARLALELSEHGYVMENGRIVLDGPSQKLIENEDIREFYLGLSKAGVRKSYKDVKHYKRRKRWLG